MEIPRNDWLNFVRKLSAINKRAADMMTEWIDANGYGDIDGMVAYAYGLTAKYGEAAAALACEMYDAVASASGASVEAAVPAEVYDEYYVSAAVRGKLASSPVEIPPLVGRMVKQAGADTMLQNAVRDGAQFAWVPNGDTCAFCITLASRGWQYQSKKAMRGGHAEHIHSNCDCTYAVRFDSDTTVGGYDPERYRRMYDNADGYKPEEKINAMRREQYKADKDEINERKRINYARNKLENQGEKTYSNLEKAIEKNIRSDIIQPAYQAQNDIRTDIPKMYEGDFSDYLGLDLAENEAAALVNLNGLSKDNNYEYGVAVIDGVVGEPFTNNDANKVQVPDELLSQKVKLFHSHTNHTPPSIPDLRFLLNKNVEEIGVISINGDTYTVSVGDGDIVDLEEFNRAAERIRVEVTNTLMDDYNDFFEWTETERNYMASKETFFRVVQHFGFRAKGGNIL